ncbi:unnamed protein product [Hymenolepis diminuta]|uniref:ANK_REP_REGION domain-containing protein n=1 Tax=Hymenolepis diminuta TaxID=6216 RepID=A0A0R3SFJ1_HYMDI|nr:unnamed protein product [Hymenolepis diminuta]
MDNATENEDSKVMKMVVRESSPQMEKKSSEHEEEGTQFTPYVRCNQCVCIDIIEYLIDNGQSGINKYVLLRKVGADSFNSLALCWSRDGIMDEMAMEWF